MEVCNCCYQPKELCDIEKMIAKLGLGSLQVVEEMVHKGIAKHLDVTVIEYLDERRRIANQHFVLEQQFKAHVEGK